MYNGIGLSSVRGTATSGHVQASRGHVRGSRLRRQQERNAASFAPKYNPVSAAARERGNVEIQRHEEKRRLENRLLELREELEENPKMSSTEVERRIQQERERQLRIWKEQDEREAQKQNAASGGEGDAQGVGEAGEVAEGALPPEEEGKAPSDVMARVDRNNRRWDNPNYERGRPRQQKSDQWERGGDRGGRGSNDDRRRRKTTNTHVDAKLKEQENERLRDALGISKDKHVEGQAFDQELQAQKKQDRVLEQERLRKAQEKEERKQAKAAKKAAKLAKKKADKESGVRSRKRRRRRRSPSTSSSSSSSSSTSTSSRNSYSSHSSSSAYSAECRSRWSPYH